MFALSERIRANVEPKEGAMADSSEPRHEPRHERGLFERVGDRVRSWFGDEEAERRRMEERGGTQTSTGYRSDWGNEYGRSEQSAQAEGSFPHGGRAGSVSTDRWGVEGPDR